MLLSCGIMSHGKDLNSYGKKKAVTAKCVLGKTMGSFLGPFNVSFWAFKPAVWSWVRLCIPLCCLHCWTDPKHDLELSQISQTNSLACLASSHSFVHTIYSFFIDLHGERGKKEGETGLALKEERKAGEPRVVEKPALQVKIQATEALSQQVGGDSLGPTVQGCVPRSPVLVLDSKD